MKRPAIRPPSAKQLAFQEQEAILKQKFDIEFKKIQAMKDDVQSLRLQEFRNKLYLSRFKLIADSS